MPRFFLSASNIADGYVTVCGDDAIHISRSLRMRAGEHITVCDMQKNEYDCELTDFTSESVTARIVSSRKCDTEPPYTVRLFQALPKSDKLDVIIQKSVETGAHEIIPFESERCVARRDDDSRKEQKKLERRSRIALEAAKQCGRGTVPTVMLPISFREMLSQAAESELVLFFYEGDDTVPLRSLLSDRYKEGKIPESISVIIGSEGGFSLKEVEAARAAGFDICGLGRRILRCETAPSFVLACLTYNFEL
ncbi:MAG: 16S rRNA (uracil(1498)-N(3))-methyltransferase [Clostridia bacterium]|nr:16S rRNA (uracil(1498)-N(3))-methyltransferase [Clostridia bacterium]